MMVLNNKQGAIDIRFSIKELERFSQIKAHTIRIWEQRYQLFQPERTPGNNRLYSFYALQHLLYLTVLSKKGYRISQLADKTYTAVSQELASLAEEQDRKNYSIVQLILAMVSANIERLEDILDDSVASFGIDVTIQDIILPFMERVDLLSYAKTSSEVHLTVTAVRRKLIYGIEKVQAVVKLEQSALLFLPHGEHYDLMLLYMTYVLKSAGFRVYYMGTNISKENLLHLAALKKPDYFFTYTTHSKVKKLLGLYENLRQELPNARLYVVHDKEALVEKNPSTVHFIYYKDFATWMSL